MIFSYLVTDVAALVVDLEVSGQYGLADLLVQYGSYDTGALLQTCSEDGHTGLVAAVLRYRGPATPVLLRALAAACRTGNTGAVKLLVGKIEDGIGLGEGLRLAAENQHKAVVLLLMRHRPEVLATPPTGRGVLRVYRKFAKALR